MSTEKILTNNNNNNFHTVNNMNNNNFNRLDKNVNSVKAMNERYNKPVVKKNQTRKRPNSKRESIKKILHQLESEPIQKEEGFFNRLFFSKETREERATAERKNKEQKIQYYKNRLKKLEIEKEMEDIIRNREKQLKKLGFKSIQEKKVANYEAMRMGYRNIEEKREKNRKAQEIGLRNNQDKMRYMQQFFASSPQEAELMNTYFNTIETNVLNQLRLFLNEKEYRAFRYEYFNLVNNIHKWAHFSSLKSLKEYEENVFQQQGKDDDTLNLIIPKNYPDVPIPRYLLYNIYIDKEKKGDGKHSNYYSVGEKGYIKRLAVLLAIKIDEFIYKFALDAARYRFSIGQISGADPQYLQNLILSVKKEADPSGNYKKIQTRRASSTSNQSYTRKSNSRSRTLSNVTNTSNPRSLAASPMNEIIGINDPNNN